MRPKCPVLSLFCAIGAGLGAPEKSPFPERGGRWLRHSGAPSVRRCAAVRKMGVQAHRRIDRPGVSGPRQGPGLLPFRIVARREPKRPIAVKKNMQNSNFRSPAGLPRPVFLLPIAVLIGSKNAISGDSVVLEPLQRGRIGNHLNSLKSLGILPENGPRRRFQGAGSGS